MQKTSNSVSFVHIGLAKCMSTTLQTLWGASQNYSYCSATQLKTSVEQNIEAEFHKTGGVPNIVDAGRVNFENKTPEMASVLSCEGLTYSWPSQAQMHSCIELKQRLLSQMLSGTTDKLLIIVRDPIDWIFSAFAQQVREGSSLNLTEYQTQFRGFFEESLNLRKTIKVWHEAGFQPVILPMELYKNDTETFWKIYERELAVLRPDSFDVTLDNTRQNTTRYEVLDEHLQLNRILDILLKSTQSKHNDMRDRQTVIDALKYAKKWGNRRGLTYIDLPQLDELRTLLASSKQINRKESVHIDDRLFTHLQENFIEPLNQYSDTRLDSFITSYSRSLLRQFDSGERLAS